MKKYLEKLLIEDIVKNAEEIQYLKTTYANAPDNLHGHKNRIADHRSQIKLDEEYLKNLDKIDFGKFE